LATPKWEKIVNQKKWFLAVIGITEKRISSPVLILAKDFGIGVLSINECQWVLMVEEQVPRLQVGLLPVHPRNPVVGSLPFWIAVPLQ